jgi:neutral amino acid transport system permease protein
MVGYLVSLIVFTAVYALFSLGLNLHWGFTGLINFGHAAFLAIGAYTTVLLSLAGVPMVVAVLLGGGLAALLGLLIGFSTLRLREDYLAIVTIGVSELIRLVALNEEWLTKGSFGVQGYDLPLADFRPTVATRIGMIVIFTAIAVLALWRLWKWMAKRLRGADRPQLLQNSLILMGYSGSLLALIYGIGMTSRALKLANSLPGGLLITLLIGSLVAVGWGYTWIARRLILPKMPNWDAGVVLLSTIALSIFGLWLYGVSAVALYNYRENPARNGLLFLSVVTVAITFWALERLVRSPWGRVLKAIREDEQVAKALGKNVFVYKLQSFMIGGFIAGVAGAFLAWQLSTVYPRSFETQITFDTWTIIVLGGAGSNAGTLLGAAIFWGYTTLTRSLDQFIPLAADQVGALRIMLIGLLLMLLMIWRPQGILGNKDELTLGK